MRIRQLFKLFDNHPTSAWVILLASSALTAWAWFISVEAIEKRAKERFEFEAADVANAIATRMRDYEVVLRSGNGLFSSSEHVSREQWRQFSETLQLENYFPGIQGLGYAVMLSPEEKAAHEEDIRAQGFTEYTVRPAGERDQYSAIVYLEPFDWRNRRAFGYDMFSEKNRREAMIRARDTGEISISGRVTLVQETTEDVQYGFLMYSPLYKSNTQLTYVEDRQRAILGYVYSPFRMGDLMSGILGASLEGLQFEIYDGENLNQDTFLYKNTLGSELMSQQKLSVNTYSGTYKLDVGGRLWSLFIHTAPHYVSKAKTSQPTLIVVFGIIIDICLFILISYLVRGRKLAQQKARQMDKALSASQQQIELAIEAGEMGLAVWDVADNRLRWDKKLLDLYGYTEETFSGHFEDWENRLHPEDRKRVLDEIEQAVKFKNKFNLSFRIILPDNSIRYVEGAVMIERDSADNVIRMVGFNTDVTDVRTKENEIKKQNWRLENVIKSTHVGAWEWNIQTGKLEVNPRWAEILGYTIDELLPITIETLKQFVHPDDLKNIQDLQQRHFKGQTEFYECDMRMRHRSGKWIWVQDRAKVFSWTDTGKPLMMFGTYQDITAQKQYEQIILEERDKAEQANKTRGEFLANMSHEIRTPINGVLGALNLLTDTHLETAQQNLVNLSKRSAESLLGLINDILDLSKIESGKLHIEDHETELVTIICDIAKSLSTKAESKGLELLCPAHYVPSLPVITDPLRIRQVLTNLLSNAIKFTDKGMVMLNVDIVKESRSKQTIRFSVIDTGSGISEEKQAHLFERFQQLDNSLTRKVGGSGLGLAISKQLVELMGGKIGVTSTLGEGSCFWFEMEFDRVAKYSTTSVVSSFTDLHVTVVCDGTAYANFYQSMLGAWKIDFECVDSFDDAISTINTTEKPSQVILVDANRFMKEESKISRYENAKTENVSLIVTCPQSMLSLMPQIISEQADQIISKPVIQSDLYNALLVEVNAEGAQPILPDMSSPKLGNFTANVLLVEDNSTNIIIAKGLLEKFGISVDIAEDGQQAIDKMKRHYFDLVLMDCQMPVMDGYETTRRIRSYKGKSFDPKTTIIALTAHAMQGDQEACFEAGMNDYLTKPVDPYELNVKLSQWLPEHCKQEHVVL